MLVNATIFGCISAYLAFKRGKNPYLWFGLGAFFGIFGIFAVFLVAPSKKSTKKPLPSPVFKIHGPADKFWYYLDPSHIQQGPMSRDAVTDAWKSGKINLSTYIWHEEMSKWKPLKETLKAESL